MLCIMCIQSTHFAYKKILHDFDIMTEYVNMLSIIMVCANGIYMFALICLFFLANVVWLFSLCVCVCVLFQFEKFLEKFGSVELDGIFIWGVRYTQVNSECARRDEPAQFARMNSVENFVHHV